MIETIFWYTVIEICANRCENLKKNNSQVFQVIKLYGIIFYAGQVSKNYNFYDSIIKHGTLVGLPELYHNVVINKKIETLF